MWLLIIGLIVVVMAVAINFLIKYIRRFQKRQKQNQQDLNAPPSILEVEDDPSVQKHL
ncbi:MAG TPA: hypothetical protein VL053_16290 [Arachidicoccus sp.]|nr:hypothetical protein [Arachidicoccus sp.]